MDHMDQIRRERATEAKVRAIDADDIVAWIHELEDTIADLEEYAEERVGYIEDLEERIVNFESYVADLEQRLEGME